MWDIGFKFNTVFPIDANNLLFCYAIFDWWRNLNKNTIDGSEINGSSMNLLCLTDVSGADSDLKQWNLCHPVESNNDYDFAVVTLRYQMFIGI